MLNIETLDAILSIAEGDLIEEMIIAVMATPQIAVFIEKFPRLKKSISNDLPNWRQKLKDSLKETDVPNDIAEEVLLYQQSQRLSASDFANACSELLNKLNSLHSAFYKNGQSILEQSPTITPAVRSLFLQRWRASLVINVTSLNQQILEDEKDKLIAELQSRMALIGDLDSALAENDTAAGKLWDMSKSTLKQSDHHNIIKYGEFLINQPELMKLAEQLGRSRESKSIPRQDSPIEQWRTQVREPAIMPEQVNGLHRSDDILRVLPPELSLLGITELEYEFYRRLIEKELLTYRLQGDAWREKIIDRPVVHQDYDEQPRGPFIVCVDTSGSMGGFNEQCAKAFCLALMRIAIADNRRCFIEMFSHDVIRYELSADDGIDQSIRFLNQRFQGGTDLNKCLRSVIERMESEEGRDADAVIISDFIAQRLPEEIIHKVKLMQKQHDHRFHAVTMSRHGKPGIMRIFDHIWRFDTDIKGRLLRRLKR